MNPQPQFTPTRPALASLAVLVLIALTPAPAAAAETAPPSGGPLFDEAVKEFKTMKLTLYQHATEVDRAAGSYKYDCVRFLSYALREAAPQAWATVVKTTKIRETQSPTPAMYQKFLLGLAAKPKPFWQAVTNVADLRPGDAVVWEHKTARANGHAVIIAGTPVKLADGSWSVEIYDATSTPHSADSRPDDARAQVFETTGRKSGLGHGTMAFTADPATGALTGYRWTLKEKPIPCPIGAGRPTK